MVIDPREYPHITWRWRIYQGDSFLGYIETRVAELALVMATFKCIVDLEHRIVELI